MELESLSVYVHTFTASKTGFSGITTSVGSLVVFPSESFPLSLTSVTVVPLGPVADPVAIFLKPLLSTAT